MRAIYLKDGTIFTTGFSRMSERQYALRHEVQLPFTMMSEFGWRPS